MEASSVLGLSQPPSLHWSEDTTEEKGYSWKVQVTPYEKCIADDVHRIHRIHEATAPRATFEAGMEDAARQALALLHHEEANSMEHS